MRRTTLTGLPKWDLKPFTAICTFTFFYFLWRFQALGPPKKLCLYFYQTIWFSTTMGISRYLKKIQGLGFTCSKKTKFPDVNYFEKHDLTLIFWHPDLWNQIIFNIIFWNDHWKAIFKTDLLLSLKYHYQKKILLSSTIFLFFLFSRT